VRSDIYAIGPRFFETMGIVLTAGEDFRPDRLASDKVAIVNDAFARAALGGLGSNTYPCLYP